MGRPWEDPKRSTEKLKPPTCADEREGRQSPAGLFEGIARVGRQLDQLGRI
jgi:hypothetical protein